MTDIAIRKTNENKTPIAAPPPPAPAAARFDPARVMRELLAWDPFREMAPFASPLPAGFWPAFEIKETSDGYVFKGDVPGVKESDLSVNVTGNRLTIAGKREAEKEEKTDTFYTCERSYGEFTRSYTLPDGVDMSTVHADLKDGVLTVSMKKTAQATTKQIAIQSSSKKS